MPAAAKDFGTKWGCFKCSTKFYDFKKPDPICPRCGADQRESPANRPVETRRGRPVTKVIEPIAEAAEPAAAEDDAEEFEDEEDDDADEV